MKKKVEHTFNHRVVHHRTKMLGTDDSWEDWYAIHEAHYDNNVPHSITLDPINVTGYTVEELRETLERMLRALDTPILEYDEFH